MTLDYDIQVYLIVQNAHGQYDRLLEDTIYAIREIAYGTLEINRYSYIEEVEIIGDA